MLNNDSINKKFYSYYPDIEVIKAFFELALDLRLAPTTNINYQNVYNKGIEEAINFSDGVASITDNNHVALLKKIIEENEKAVYTLFNSMPSYLFQKEIFIDGQSEIFNLLPNNTLIFSPVLQPNGNKDLNNACSICTYFIEALIKKNGEMISFPSNINMEESLIRITKILYEKVALNRILFDKISSKLQFQPEELTQMPEFDCFKSVLENEMKIWEFEYANSGRKHLNELIAQKNAMENNQNIDSDVRAEFLQEIEILEKQVREMQETKENLRTITELFGTEELIDLNNLSSTFSTQRLDQNKLVQEKDEKTDLNKKKIVLSTSY